MHAVLRREFHLPRSTPQMAAVDALLQRCLAKDAQDRPRSADELRMALIPALRACPPLR
jgi:serine/threonine protein kinase